MMKNQAKTASVPPSRHRSDLHSLAHWKLQTCQVENDRILDQLCRVSSLDHIPRLQSGLAKLALVVMCQEVKTLQLLHPIRAILPLMMQDRVQLKRYAIHSS